MVTIFFSISMALRVARRVATRAFIIVVGSTPTGTNHEKTYS
jgi:hypothetical protein